MQRPKNAVKDFFTITKAQWRFLILFFSVFLILRLAFFAVFQPVDLHAPTSEYLRAFALGARFDLRLCALMLLPLTLVSFYAPANPIFNAKARTGWSLFYAVFSFFIVVLYCLDFGYYGYLERRLNATIFNFGENLAISAEMLNETYHAGWALLGLVILSVGLFYFYRRILLSDKIAITTPIRKIRASHAGVFLLLTIISIHGSLNQYPLRWSDAYFSEHRFVADLSLNPVLFLNDTYSFRENPYDTAKVKSYYEQLSTYWGVEKKDESNLSFKRPVALTPVPTPKPPNVIYIIMESFAAYKTGTWGNKLSPSPYFDRYAKEGILFKNFFVPSEATARSIFTMFTSSPDMTMRTTSTRNPFLVEQNTVLNAFKNYEKYYFIGGSASWGNIRGVLKNNAKDLQFYEESNLEGPRTDVWGLSDYDLFKATIKVLSQRRSDKPFFAYIQSASFHRPFTIPGDSGSFEVKHPTAKELSDGGFMSEAEYNSFRFSDFSLGQFLELASQDPAFSNTIFVVHGDHGLPHYNAAHLGDGFKSYGLNRFNVPLLIYAPGILKPGVRDTMASEVDVMPTLAGITNHPYEFCSMGRNIFAPDQTHRYNFSFAYYSSPLEILLYDQEYLVKGIPGKTEGLYRYKDVEFKKDLSAEQPEKFKEMSDLLQAHYEMGRWLNYNNKTNCLPSAQPQK